MPKNSNDLCYEMLYMLLHLHNFYTQSYYYDALYLPNLLTIGPTKSDPKNPPRGYIETVMDHRSVRRLPSIGSPYRRKYALEVKFIMCYKTNTNACRVTAQ